MNCSDHQSLAPATLVCGAQADRRFTAAKVWLVFPIFAFSEEAAQIQGRRLVLHRSTWRCCNTARAVGGKGSVTPRRFDPIQCGHCWAERQARLACDPLRWRLCVAGLREIFLAGPVDVPLRVTINGDFGRRCGHEFAPRACVPQLSVGAFSRLRHRGAEGRFRHRPSHHPRPAHARGTLRSFFLKCPPNVVGSQPRKPSTIGLFRSGCYATLFVTFLVLADGFICRPPRFHTGFDVPFRKNGGALAGRRQAGKANPPTPV